MFEGNDDHQKVVVRQTSISHGRGKIPDFLIGVFFFVVVLAVSFFLVDRLGLKFLALGLGGIVTVLILGYASLREMSFALMIWLFIMSGFRVMGMVNMPGLPDLSLDRILLIWIITIFVLRVVLKGERFPGPYWPDLFLLFHTVYILVQMQFIGSNHHFHHWVLSMLTPFMGFIYGKYTVKKDSELRNLLLFFLVLSVYYFIMSIAQHFSIEQLIWPKTILNKAMGLWHKGRSRGPVLHPPMFGQLIAMLVMVNLFFLARVKTVAMKLLFGGCLLGSLIGSLFTYTRGPWVSLVVGLGFLAVMSRNYRKVVLIMALVGVLGGVLGVAQLANSDFLKERIENTNTIENRIGFLANTLRVMRDYPIFGIGYYRWLDYLGEYNQTTVIPFYGVIRKNTSAHVPIHDIYLGRIAEEGLLGGALQWAFYLTIFNAFRRKWKAGVWSRWFNRDTLIALAGILVVYMVGGMVIDYRYFDLINVIFYLIAGIIYGYEPGGQSGGEPNLVENPDLIFIPGKSA